MLGTTTTPKLFRSNADGVTTSDANKDTKNQNHSIATDGNQILSDLKSDRRHQLREIKCEGSQLLAEEHLEEMNLLLRKNHSSIHLESLELPNNQLSASATEPLANILVAQHETLQCLNLSHNPITPRGLVRLVDPLIGVAAAAPLPATTTTAAAAVTAALPPSLGGSASRNISGIIFALRSLDLTCTKLGQKEGAAAIATLLRNNSTLEELRLGGNHFGKRGITTLAPALAQNSTLRLLDVSDNKIGPQGVKAIAQALEAGSAVSNLRVLDVSSNNIRSAGMEAFAKLMITDRKLEGFYAGRNKLGTEGAREMGIVLKHNFTLKDVRLEGNEIGDAGVAHLANGLLDDQLSSRNASLERLDLSYNAIEKDGAVCLAEVLRENAKLSHINLSGNQIGSDGAIALARSLAYNLTLKRLVLTNNNIEDSGAFGLAMALGRPSCSLEEIRWEENPIKEKGLASLKRVPQLRRNHDRWLGQMLRSLSRGSATNIVLTDRTSQVGDEEILLLTDVLAENHPLVRSMMLDGSTLTSRSMVSLIERAFPSPSNILRLFLTNFEQGDSVARALAEVLPNNNRLEVLCLKNCCISSAVAECIANGLKGNSTLRRLNLDRNQIGDEGMLALSRTLPHPSLASFSAATNQITDTSMSLDTFKTLEELNLNGNEITDLGVYEFCRSFMMIEEHSEEGSSNSPTCALVWVHLSQNKITNRGGGMLKSCLPNAIVAF